LAAIAQKEKKIKNKTTGVGEKKTYGASDLYKM
jgi:hypothetical protein